MYQVTITKIEKESTTTQEYEKIADSGNKEDDGAVYGYVDKTETENKRTEIYNQRVEDINLVAVIDAVNKVNKTQTQPSVVKDAQ